MVGLSSSWPEGLHNPRNQAFALDFGGGCWIVVVAARKSTTPEIERSRSISGVIAGLSWWWRLEEVHNPRNRVFTLNFTGRRRWVIGRGQRSSTTPEIEHSHSILGVIGG